MAKRIPVDISTTNKNLKGEDGKDLKVEVTVQAEVPENLQEAAEFYGDEEKLLDSIQGDVARRKANAARPLLRDAESVQDWNSIAQQAVDQYQPGRRGGFGAAPTIAEEELRGATDMDSLLALLRQKGFNIQSGGADVSNVEQDNIDEETGDEVNVGQ